MMNYKQYTLQNGVRVILVPQKDMTTATIEIGVRAGARFEETHESGIAHFLEHMFFKGTTKRTTPGKIAEDLEMLGAQYNAFTSIEQVGYWAKVPAKNALGAVEVLSDLFLNPTFPAKEITKEARTICQEIQMYEDNPQDKVLRELPGHVFGEHELAHEVLGSIESVRSFRRKDFVAYRERLYTPERTVVVVAGNFPQQKILAVLRKSFGVMQPGPVVAATHCDIARDTAAGVHHIKKDTEQSHIAYAFPYVPADEKEWVAARLLSYILGGGMTSRLWQEVREKRGLAYTVRASLWRMEEISLFLIYAGTEHGAVAQVHKLIEGEVKKIARGGVSAAELKRARNMVLGRLSFGHESSDDITDHVINHAVFDREIASMRELEKRVMGVSRVQLHKLAKKILNKKQMTRVTLGPRG